jgi:hypothetical protein
MQQRIGFWRLAYIPQQQIHGIDIPTNPVKKPLPGTHTIFLTVLVIAIQRAQEELGIGIQRRRRTIHSCCC